MEPRI
jgi:hypothetical protein